MKNNFHTKSVIALALTLATLAGGRLSLAAKAPLDEWHPQILTPSSASYHAGQSLLFTLSGTGTSSSAMSVSVSSSISDISVPSTVTIPAGASSTTFYGTVGSTINPSGSALITANANGSEVSVGLLPEAGITAH